MNAIRNATMSVSATPLGIVYGPIESRRFGRSLGINLLDGAEKICSFNCRYCDLGATQIKLNKLKRETSFPTLEEISAATMESFRILHEKGPSIDTICLSGNGEPTLHPDFPEAIREILSARDRWLPGKPVKILTSGAMLDTRKIAEAVNRLDERIVKIDAGNEKIFKMTNAPLSRTTLAKVITGARSLRDLIVQSLFVQGTVNNTAPPDVDDWIEVIALLKPKAVQIHGISRLPSMSGLIRCDEDTLYTIASRLERRTQIKALVTP